MSDPVILIVEDEPDLLQVMASSITHSMSEYDVKSATSIDEAELVLSELAAQSGELALVVVDHVLGGRTGLELLESLSEHHPRVPTLLFTGQAPQGIETRARRAGARVLWKPAKLKVLLGEVQTLLAG